MTVQPGWETQAQCAGMGVAVFFDAPLAAARRICDGCPVRAPCAEAGRTEYAGVWGGVRARGWGAARKDAARCGTPSGYRSHLRHGDPACTACLAAHAASVRASKARKADGAKTRKAEMQMSRSEPTAHWSARQP